MERILKPILSHNEDSTKISQARSCSPERFDVGEVACPKQSTSADLDEGSCSTPCNSTLRKKAPGHRQQDSSPKRKRSRKHCYVAGCEGFVVNLHRRFQQIHTDIPQFEARLIIKKMKKSPGRSYPVLSCPECDWTGTQGDKHLASKSHGYEKAMAKLMAKQIR